MNGDAVIDVLIPEGTGERTATRASASGFPTVAAPGGSQALTRSEIVEVQAGSRTGKVPRPLLLSAMILKAAAYSETAGSGRERHCYDFAALAAVLAAGDTASFPLQPKDRKRLHTMIRATLATPTALAVHPGAVRRLRRLSELVEA